MVPYGLCVGGDASLTSEVCAKDAGPPPVLHWEAESASQFGFRVLEGRESLGLLSKGGPRQLPIPPDSEGHPVVVDLHEHDGARLAPAGREMLEDRQPSRMVRSRDLVRIFRAAPPEFAVMALRLTRLEIPRPVPPGHERFSEHPN